MTTVYKLYYYTYNTEGELKMTTELKAAAEELGTVQDDGDALVALEHSSFKEVVEPLMKWLADNHHPMCTVIVTSTNSELVEGIESFSTDNFLKD